MSQPKAPEPGVSHPTTEAEPLGIDRDRWRETGAQEGTAAPPEPASVPEDKVDAKGNRVAETLPPRK